MGAENSYLTESVAVMRTKDCYYKIVVSRFFLTSENRAKKAVKVRPIGVGTLQERNETGKQRTGSKRAQMGAKRANSKSNSGVTTSALLESSES